MALISPAFDELLVRSTRALEPFGVHAVLIGGCANALYRHHPLSVSSAPRPLLTSDADFATPAGQFPDRPSLRTRLEAEGLHLAPPDRPTNKYKLHAEAIESLEVLCPMAGLSRELRNSSPALVPIQDDVTAEALDYLDLLLIEPWCIDLSMVPELGVRDSLAVHIPNPVAYVLQKALVRSKRREREKRAKDAYYIYEVAVLFRRSLDRLGKDAAAVRAQAVPKWLQRAVAVLETIFRDANAEGVQEAERVAVDSGQDISPQMILPPVSRLVAMLRNELIERTNQ